MLILAGILIAIAAFCYQLHVRMTTGHDTQDGTPITPDISWPLRIALAFIVAGVFRVVMSP